MKKDIYGLVAAGTAIIFLGLWPVIGKMSKVTEPAESKALETVSEIKEKQELPQKIIVQNGAETVQAETTVDDVYELETLNESTISETETQEKEIVPEGTSAQETVGLTEPSGEDYDISETDRVPETAQREIIDTEPDIPESDPEETAKETEEETTEETTKLIIEVEEPTYIPELQA